MFRASSRLYAALLAALCVCPVAARAQDGPPPAVRATIQSVEHMLGGSGDASLTAFANERLAPAYRASFTPESLLAHLKKLRAALGGEIGGVTIDRDPEGLVMSIQGAREVAFRLVLDASAKITRLELINPTTSGAAPADSIWGATTWESLGVDLSRAEAAGFSGTFLALHGGKEVVRSALGVTDRTTKHRTALNTVYCIGSTPIDFTATGILLLAQRGKLALDDPIGRWFPDVPADKRAMTLRQLLTGKSGLPDFHHLSTDWDADLAWIDRETAVRRILHQPLLFAPGAGQAHSHSAFGLLAAVIEIVSGSRYQDFVRKEILTPLAMTRTGFYGEALGLGVEEFAVGYGNSSVGIPNISPNWGPTSWLVMGSGGMFSTLGDMEQYYSAIAEGRLLSGEWAKWQQRPGVDVGGSDRGFYIFRANNGRGNQILFLMNGEGRSPGVRAMTRRLERLVLAP